MRIPVSMATPDVLRGADVILAADPARPGWGVQLFGREAVPRAGPGPAREVVVCEVELDSRRPGEVRRLRDLVAAAKGGPPDGAAEMC